LYRTQERPLAVVSWPERQPDRYGFLGYFSTTEDGQLPGIQDPRQDGEKGGRAE
jgi:hypothetical protein